MRGDEPSVILSFETRVLYPLSCISSRGCLRCEKSVRKIIAHGNSSLHMIEQNTFFLLTFFTTLHIDTYHKTSVLRPYRTSNPWVAGSNPAGRAWYHPFYSGSRNKRYHFALSVHGKSMIPLRLSLYSPRPRVKTVFFFSITAVLSENHQNNRKDFVYDSHSYLLDFCMRIGNLDCPVNRIRQINQEKGGDSYGFATKNCSTG